jgi:hypothetical protein
MTLKMEEATDVKLEALILNEEKIQEMEGVKCKPCESKVTPHTKQDKTIQTGNIMIFSISRADPHGHKKNTRLEFPTRNLRLPNLAGKTYNLHAVVLHHGNTAKSGHYTTLTKLNKKWYHIDDDKEIEINEDQLTNLNHQRNATILIYKTPTHDNDGLRAAQLRETNETHQTKPDTAVPRSSISQKEGVDHIPHPLYTQMSDANTYPSNQIGNRIDLTSKQLSSSDLISVSIRHRYNKPKLGKTVLYHKSMRSVSKKCLQLNRDLNTDPLVIDHHTTWHSEIEVDTHFGASITTKKDFMKDGYTWINPTNDRDEDVLNLTTAIEAIEESTKPARVLALSSAQTQQTNVLTHTIATFPPGSLDLTIISPYKWPVTNLNKNTLTLTLIESVITPPFAFSSWAAEITKATGEEINLLKPAWYPRYDQNPTHKLNMLTPKHNVRDYPSLRWYRNTARKTGGKYRFQPTHKTIITLLGMDNHPNNTAFEKRGYHPSQLTKSKVEKIKQLTREATLKVYKVYEQNRKRRTYGIPQ